MGDVVPDGDGPLALRHGARPGGGLDNTTRLALRWAGAEPDCWAGRRGWDGSLDVLMLLLFCVLGKNEARPL